MYHRVAVDRILGDPTAADVLRGAVAHCRARWLAGDPVASDAEYDDLTRLVRREMGLLGMPMQANLFNVSEYRGAAPPALVPPVVKYAGSKRWLVSLLVPRLHLHLANVSGTLVSPFFGSGALELALGWRNAVYGDLSPDHANLYAALAADPGAVADALDTLAALGDGESRYYAVRKEIWPEARGKLSSAGWAARVIWLVKNNYNGLWRVRQSDGRYNVPWGKRVGVKLPGRAHLAEVGAVLARSTFLQGDFAATIAEALRRATLDKIAAYVDPPYGGEMKDVSRGGARDRKNASKVFTGYAGKFTWGDQVRLAEVARDLARGGALVVASNAWRDEICDLYRDGFVIFQVGVQHSVGATGARRGRRAEMLAVSEAHAGVIDSASSRLVRRR